MQDIARHVGTFHVHLLCSRKTKLTLVQNGNEPLAQKKQIVHLKTGCIVSVHRLIRSLKTERLHITLLTLVPAGTRGVADLNIFHEDMHTP